MRVRVRISLLALAVGATVGVIAPGVAQAFSVTRFVAANCSVETCGEGVAEAEAGQLFTKAAGHPNFGITDFTLKTNVSGEPEGKLIHVRTDVAPGVSTNPQATPKCSTAAFGAEPYPNFFLPPTCNEEMNANSTVLGTNKVVVFIEGVGPYPLEGKVYNLEQPVGISSEFGVAIKLPAFLVEAFFKGSALEKAPLYVHTLIEGHVEWASDYHDYFEINVSPTLPTISSRLVFNGRAGTGTFLTNPSSCSVRGPATTSTLTLKSEAGETVKVTSEAARGSEECATVPFAPTFAVTPETTQLDEPDGLTVNLAIPQKEEATTQDSSYLKTAEVTLPEGVTINPSAAHGLEACTEAQIGIGTRNAVTCPAGSKLGTVTLKVPGLPVNEPLEGSVYLGGTAPITGPPYTVYIDAETARYGGSLRVKGEVVPNETTGQLTAKFTQNPESPFSDMIIKFNGGARAPLANSLTCGTATTTATFGGYRGNPLVPTTVAPFTIDGNGAGGACLAPLPFVLGLGTINGTANAGAHTAYTFTLKRAGGQQYLEKVSTVLPEGLTAEIPAVSQCGAAEAATGACPAASRIGTATVLAGSGSEPYSFTGPVYLTGPYNGAPYGLSVAVPAVAGPFNLGTVVTRATINVNPTTTRVTVAATLPTIVKGVPLRVRELTVDVEKSGYLLNPTNCSAEATETTLTSTLGATQSLSSPFQVSNCSALKFKPVFASKTSAKTSKQIGASIETTINQPAGEANIASVLVQLPKVLPSRLTTLQKACPEATAAIDIYDCPPGSKVGGVRANTPLLPGKMTGSAYLVSHGGEAFPDLDLVMEADGVRVVLVGHTKITKGITTTLFQTLPDVPVTSITVNLPTGPNSAVAATGNLCKAGLVMPTTITAQNGKTFKQNTVMKIPNCPVEVVAHRVIGNTAYLSIKTFTAGRVSGSGPGLSKTYRRLGAPHNELSLKVPLSSAGRGRGRPFSVRLRVGFVPSSRGIPNSVAYQTVTFG